MKLTLPCEMREKRELKKERGGGSFKDTEVGVDKAGKRLGVVM